jgi:hypothetical protein
VTDREPDDERHHGDGGQDHEADDSPVDSLREIVAEANEHQRRGDGHDQAETAFALAVVAMVLGELAG